MGGLVPTVSISLWLLLGTFSLLDQLTASPSIVRFRRRHRERLPTSDQTVDGE
jgi:hypothetical protein